MGTIKTYSLFTINQDNKIDETHDCGKQERNRFDPARNSWLLKRKRIAALK